MNAFLASSGFFGAVGDVLRASITYETMVRLAALPMAFVFAALRTGSGFLSATGVERRIADVVQAMLVLALLIPPAVQAIQRRRSPKEAAA